MTKKEICMANPTFAIICRGYVGYELRHIEYTPDGDFLYIRCGNGKHMEDYHKVKIHYGANDTFIRIYNTKFSLSEALRV